MRYELTDYEWHTIKPFLPNKPRGVPRVVADEANALAIQFTNNETLTNISPQGLIRIIPDYCSWYNDSYLACALNAFRTCCYF